MIVKSWAEKHTAIRVLRKEPFKFRDTKTRNAPDNV